MTLKLWILWMVSLLIPCALVAPAAGADLAGANRLYQQEQYEQAAAGYEELLAKGGPDAALYYNLGNAYQKLERYGPAILAYERARLLTPRNPDLLANLARARKEAAAFDQIHSDPRVAAALGYFSRNEWGWLVASSALWIGAVILIRGVFSFSKRWIPRAMSVSIGLAVLGASIGGTALWMRKGEDVKGIIVSPTATVRLSPFESAGPVGTPSQGNVVRMGAKTGRYHYVEVPGTPLKGWLSEGEVEAIIPPSSGK